MKQIDLVLDAELGRVSGFKIDSQEYFVVRTDEIINSFLKVGEYRITPSDVVGEEDLSSSGEESEIVSEEMAEIYIKQGLQDKADAIYRKLRGE